MTKLKKTLKLISVILVLAFCSVICSCAKKDKGPENSIIYYNISYEPDTLDPQIANDNVSDLIILNIYEGLVKKDENNDITEGAAQKWDISDDKMTYTFHLRKNLKWSDGSALTAKDFVYGIQRSVMKQTSSPTAKTLFCIKNAESINKNNTDINSLGISAPDNNTVKIELEYPDSNILQILTTPPAMPCSKSFFDKSEGQYGRVDDKILGNGAFLIEKGDWVSDKYIFLSRNKNYTGKDQPVPLGVNFSIKEISDVYKAITEKDIDCGALSNTDVDEAEKSGLNLKSFQDSIWGISFNTEDDVLKNKNIRHSLLSIINKNNLLKNLPENCTKTSYLIPDSAELENVSYRSVSGKVEYNQSDEPEQLLSDGLKELELTSIPNITILCSNDADTQSFVNDLIETWNSFTGAYFNKKPVSQNELEQKINNGIFQIVIAPLKISGTTPLHTLELFESSSKHNTAMLRSEEFDLMIGDIRKNLTLSSVDKIKNAEQYILDEALFYPLYTQDKYYASAENVTDIIYHPYGAEIDFFYAQKTEE